MMYFVYILFSEKYPQKYYIGMTINLEERINKHNTRQSYYSKRYAPWRLETYIAFRSEHLAKSFERYLKHGSGLAFLKKHFI